MDYKIGTNYNGFVLVREENIKGRKILILKP